MLFSLDLIKKKLLVPLNKFLTESPQPTLDSLALIESIDVQEFVAELKEFVPAKGWSLRRARHLDAHKATMNITLRRSSTRLIRHLDDKSYHTQLSHNSDHVKYFTKILKFLHDFSAKNNARLSRVNVVLLLPKQTVRPHFDYGEYYSLRHRYHLVLVSEGSIMTSGKERKTFFEGDLFYLDNRIIHSAENMSDGPRIHVIFDLMPRGILSLTRCAFSILKTAVINFIASVKNLRSSAS